MEGANLSLYELDPDAAMGRKVRHLVVENIEFNSQANDLQIINQVDTENEYPFEPIFGDVVEFLSPFK